MNKEPVWHEVLLFSPRAIESAKSMKKGDRVHVKGDLSYKEVETKEGHKAQQASEISKRQKEFELNQFIEPTAEK